ncbi:MAG TPA: PAS domain S-box protein [Xanthomonadales bacterium]|nr:PAS domain S-box protein [Xanthomonadales bacterium]
MTPSEGESWWRHGEPAPHEPAPQASLAAALTRLESALHGAPEAADPAVALAEALALLHRLNARTDAIRRRYDSLFDAVPDPVVLLDENGILLDLNAAAEASYGEPRDALIGRSIRSINPSLPADHMQPVWRALERGGTHVEETVNRRHDGSHFRVEVHSASFIDEGDRRIVAVARDLSFREEAERRYRELLDTIDKGVIVQDRTGRLVSGNSAAWRILGLPADASPADLQLRDWRLLDPEGRTIQIRDLPALRALREGKAIDSTLVGLYHRRKRHLRWISITAVPQFEPNPRHTGQNWTDPSGTRPNQASHVISLFSDVTELKRNDSLFRRAQSLARIGGWEWDRSRGLWHLTAHALTLLGLDQHASPLPIARLLDCIHSEDRYTARVALARLAQTGQSARIEFRLETDPYRAPVWLRLIGEAEGTGPLATRIIGTIQDVSESKQAETELRRRAHSDPLTGLLNRDGIQAELDMRLNRHEPSGLALLYVDLDRFKTVNDLLGHAVGDDVLIGVAQRLRISLGEDGLLARFGGDEFLILVDAPTDPDLPYRLARRITENFGERIRYGSEEFSITASVGVAIHPRDGRSAQQLIRSADAAMYDAKRRGRSTWQAFNPTLSQRQRDRLTIENQLARALDNDEFRLVFQPQVDLASGRILAAEALIRWHNPTLGDMPPDRFIQHAESTGDIVRIGEWVLRQSCAQLCRWREAGHRIARIGVNVSYRQFLNESLADIVAANLSEFGLTGDSIELEFTERVLIEDVSDTVRTFESLRLMGIKLTIDDFGEGYSALNYLRRLPIDGVKISKSFLQGVPDEASDVAICRAITGIARSLGLDVVAEGVENASQRRFLLQNGVRLGQGFLFAPGLPGPEIATLLQRQTTQ